jgi:hypothetical protein
MLSCVEVTLKFIDRPKKHLDQPSNFSSPPIAREKCDFLLLLIALTRRPAD